jgi:hypothetical protein
MSKKSELEILNSYCDKWGKGNFIMHFGVWLNEELGDDGVYYQHYDGTKEQLEGNFKGFLTNFKGMEIICKDIEDHQISSLKSWRKYERKNEEISHA